MMATLFIINKEFMVTIGSVIKMTVYELMYSKNGCNAILVRFHMVVKMDAAK